MASNGSNFTLVSGGSSYSYERAITVNAGEVTGTQVNFPMLISGTYPYLATVGNGGNVTNGNGYDIIFTSDAVGANLLNWEVESYNPATGAVVMWVRIPSLTAGTVIYEWYGNAAISTFQGGAVGSVWDANFKGVWHLPNGTTLVGNDSTSNGNNAKGLNGTGATSGKIDGGASFNGTSNWIDIPGSPMFGGGNQISLSSWVKAGTVSGLQNLVSWPTAINAIPPPQAWAWYLDPGGQIELDLYSNSPGSLEYVVSSGAISAGTWTHVYATYDGTTMRMYINGTADPNTQATSLTVGTSSIDVSIGQNQISGHNNFYDGNLDEVRISSTARSAGWIATEYANQSNPTAFYSISPAQ